MMLGTEMSEKFDIKYLDNAMGGWWNQEFLGYYPE